MVEQERAAVLDAGVHIPVAGRGVADRLAELSYVLSDLAADVPSYATSVETDPLRLAQVSERRAALAALTRKYGDSVDEVLAWSATAARRLLALEGGRWWAEASYD